MTLGRGFSRMTGRGLAQLPILMSAPRPVESRKVTSDRSIRSVLLAVSLPKKSAPSWATALLILGSIEFLPSFSTASIAAIAAASSSPPCEGCSSRSSLLSFAAICYGISAVGAGAIVVAVLVSNRHLRCSIPRSRRMAIGTRRPTTSTAGRVFAPYWAGGGNAPTSATVQLVAGQHHTATASDTVAESGWLSG
jgi:hypothetical protein